MCGIAGIRLPRAADGEALRALAAMRAAQRERGPDDAGEHWAADQRVGLANCRLAIRDLSPAGHMPMCADEVCITYNGEIYNATELRGQLERIGQRFTSQSDTEVILRGYLAWGAAVVTRLRGMFAFGIHDARTDTLLLARDPLGIKPLYHSRGQPFCFASELEALLASGLVGRGLDEEGLSAYLQLGSIPAPLTIYADARALQPGHIAAIGADGIPVIQRYWNFPEQRVPRPDEDIMGALQDAVAAHMVADVPVGAFLSGGLDSSVVVTLAQEKSAEPMHTCSIAFDSPEHDESRYARAVAVALGTRHHERLITRADFLGSMGAFISALDQPSIDGFNTYFVAQAAHEAGLKVALSGLGGDELFGGYPSFRGVPRMRRWLRSARVVGGARAANAITMLTRSDRWRKVADAARRSSSRASALLVYRGLFTQAETYFLLNGRSAFDALHYIDERAGSDKSSTRNWVGNAELSTYTASQLLRDADVMSMAHSLELRVPLLDTRLVELVCSLPDRQRFGGRGSKPLLRRLMRDRLPAAITAHRPRQGFTFPIQHWLRQDDKADLWQWDAPVFEYFDQTALREVRDRFAAGKTHWSRAWSLMALNEWSRRSAHA